MGLFIAIFGVSLLLAVLGVASMEVCPFCHARGSFKYLHRKVDGRPDQRYRHNPVICTRCGKARSLRPPSAAQVAEVQRWKQHGFETGRAGGVKEVPAEIRPMIGDSNPLSAAWYTGWFDGDRQYMWETGFTDGLAGKQNFYRDFNTWRYQGWVEGDAKRKGLHYFSSWDAKTKLKDVIVVDSRGQ